MFWLNYSARTQLPGAGRTRAWHHHGSHTPVNPNILAASVLKVAFFSESVISFSNLQKKYFPKNYPELEI